MKNQRTKTFADTFIYTTRNNNNAVEQSLFEYIMKADRIDKSSTAFRPILDMMKTRQTTAVLYRILLLDEVVLGIYNKELPASFKVFAAKDVKGGSKKRKVFIDVTGLIKLNDAGYFTCKEIDKLCSYLISALTNLIYYFDPDRIFNNGTMVRLSTLCYTKLFTGVLDYLRVINYSENKIKIGYITAVYFLYSVLNKDITVARKSATSILSLSVKETSAWDIYYDYEKDFSSIKSYVDFLSATFKLKDLTVDVFIDRWIYLYGKGTMYGCELYPSFLSILTNAYSGAYLNNQKKIEASCGKDMVTISTTILQIGSDMYDKGFKYESAMDYEAASHRLERNYQ